MATAAYPLRRTASHAAAGARPAPAQQAPRQQYLELRADVHRKLLNRLNLEALAHADRAARRGGDPHAAGTAARRGVRRRSTWASARRSSPRCVDDVFGLGPLEPLLRDPTISDILVNTHAARLRRAQGPAGARARRRSRTTRTCCASSTASSAASAAAWTTARRWWMRACPTARASTPSFRRWRWTARCCRSAGFRPSG